MHLSPAQAIEMLIARLNEVQGMYERQVLINCKLLDYIAEWHNEMSLLSEKVAQNTDTLFTSIADIERIKEGGVDE